MLIAVGATAYMLADIAHEVVGHGIGYLLAGGRNCILTTTRLIAQQPLPDWRWRVFDLVGPVGNLLGAALGWALVRSRGRARLLGWLFMAFSLFWFSGYLAFSGVVGSGDFLALLPGGAEDRLGRVVLVVSGAVLYVGSVRFVARELWRMIPQDKSRRRRIALVGYLAGGVIACLGAVGDPRGVIEVLRSGALSSFAAAAGLLRLSRSEAGVESAERLPVIMREQTWLLASAVFALLYACILGPGVHVRL